MTCQANETNECVAQTEGLRHDEGSMQIAEPRTLIQFEAHIQTPWSDRLALDLVRDCFLIRNTKMNYLLYA
jgi:hypothetical protein